MNSTSILDLVDWLDLNKGWEVFLFLFFFLIIWLPCIRLVLFTAALFLLVLLI